MRHQSSVYHILLLTHTEIRQWVGLVSCRRPFNQWAAIAGWAGPLANHADGRPIQQWASPSTISVSLPIWMIHWLLLYYRRELDFLIFSPVACYILFFLGKSVFVFDICIYFSIVPYKIYIDYTRVFVILVSGLAHYGPEQSWGYLVPRWHTYFYIKYGL